MTLKATIDSLPISSHYGRIYINITRELIRINLGGIGGYDCKPSDYSMGHFWSVNNRQTACEIFTDKYWRMQQYDV